MTHAVFFDRDGIVNERRIGDYVTTWGEFHFLPDIFSALPAIQGHGFLALLVTNQRGIAIGRMTQENLDEIHSRMQNELMSRCGHAFDALLVCPHADEDHCDCRKPLPGLLMRAIAEYNIDPRLSWMIGDSERDVVAGNRAECRSILVGADGETSATFRCATLHEAVDTILATVQKEIH